MGGAAGICGRFCCRIGRVRSTAGGDGFDRSVLLAASNGAVTCRTEMQQANWIVPPIWTGEDAFILAGGPSLGNVDLGPLADRHVIVINDSYRLASWAECLYFADLKWWQRSREDVMENFKGQYIVTVAKLDEPGVKRLRVTGQIGLDADPSALRHGSNSGYQAIHLAYHFGAKRIV